MRSNGAKRSAHRYPSGDSLCHQRARDANSANACTATRATQCHPGTVRLFLTPSRAGALECVSCRNVKRWAFKTWDTRELLQKTHMTRASTSSMSSSSSFYEDKCTAPQNAVLKHPEELPETLGSATVLQVTSSVSIQGEMMLGILWPCEVYKLHEGRDPPKELVKVYTHNNQKIHGLLREPKHGQPIGTIGLTQKCAETVSRAMTVVDSTTAPRGRAQVQETFEALRGRASVSVNVTGRGEGAHDEALGLTFKAKGSKKDDNDDGPFLNAFVGYSHPGLVHQRKSEEQNFWIFLLSLSCKYGAGPGAHGEAAQYGICRCSCSQQSTRLV